MTLCTLFICRKNKWRSPTAEKIFRRHEGVATRSAGTNSGARRQVSVADVQWADVIFVMEEKHLSRMRSDFRRDMKNKTVYVLDIPDDYQFMDPELIELLHEVVTPLIETAGLID